MKKAKDGLGLSMGACFVAGALERNGFDVDYYDLNLALNSFRKSNFSSDHLVQELTDQNKFLHSYISHDSENEIANYLSHLVQLLPRKEYSAICFSLDRRDYFALVNKATFNFSLLLARELKKKYSIPIYMGGYRVLDSLGRTYTDKILNSLPDKPIDKISYVSTLDSFAAYLKEVENGLEIESEKAEELFHKKDGISKAGGLIPKYLINNSNDLFANVNEILPDFLIKKFPKLNEIAPHFIAPYKFSVGCPFTCAFCSDGNDPHFRQHRPEQIAQTLSTLSKKNIKFFSFYNNNINLNRFFLNKLQEGLKANNTKIYFSDSANLQMATPEVFAQLREMGCIKLWYGTETISSRLLKIIDKDLDRKKIEAGLDAALSNEIWNCCNFIHSFPHETDQEFEDLLTFIRDSDKFKAYSINQFRLLKRSAYYANPEQYQIKINTLSANGIVAVYDEINGKTWDEKKIIGKERQKLAVNVRRKINNMLAQNDHILFSMRGIGLNNHEISQILETYSSFLYKENLLKDYEDKHTFSISEANFDKAPIGSEFGQDMNINSILSAQQEITL